MYKNQTKLKNTLELLADAAAEALADLVLADPLGDLKTTKQKNYLYCLCNNKKLDLSREEGGGCEDKFA